MTVGVDLMGGDQPPEAIYEAACEVAKQSDHKIVVFATPQHVPTNLPPNVTLHTSESSIEMDEPPLLAVRRKKGSTMADGCRHLKSGKIDAFVSSGNTGALVATSLFHLKKLPGIDRPALLVTMPTATGHVIALDVGANVHPKPHQLVAYAHLGSRYCDKKDPTIGLLNIGTEEQKGTREMKQSFRLLQEHFGSRFLGNIEGREVFQGKVDVLVTDGFTGNVFLKTSEGISGFLVSYLLKHFDAKEIVKKLNQTFNYAAHPGALLCGVDGIVVKCHGYSDKQAMINGIKGAAALVHADILSTLKSTD